MARNLGRRTFMAGSAAAAVGAGCASPSQAGPGAGSADREHYELRIYRTTSAKRSVVSAYLEKAFVPALNRMGIDRVGVFESLDDPKDPSLTVLVPYRTLDLFDRLNDTLEADAAYQTAAKAYFSRPLKDPAYTRIESRLMKAFKSIPVIEMPAQTKARRPRIFELRTYESHTEAKARRKVAMFDEGETQVMRDCGMAPVFFGEMLVGHDVPNLTYILSASDMDAHKEHWNAFRKHPDWLRMKVMDRYKDTVSKITKWFLKPAPYSQI